MKDFFMCLLACACLALGYVALDQREDYLTERRNCDILRDLLLKKERMIAAQAKILRERPVVWKKKVVYKELP